jgi:putative solute:sodium symporter small subunit
MLHKPAVELEKDESAPRKAKLGIIMFVCYLVVYTGFVFIGVMFPSALSVNTIGGMNLAFTYGMGLIVLAIIMGLFYNYFCTRFENQVGPGDKP